MILDDDTSATVTWAMLKHYGDLLKVSRSSGVYITLPKLRESLANKKNADILKKYQSGILEELEGQGIAKGSRANRLLSLQLSAFKAGSAENNSTYADELKRLIQQGQIVAEEYAKVQEIEVDKDEVDSDRIDNILFEPSSIDPASITDEEAALVRQQLLGSFQLFSEWSFQLQMGYKFLLQDFHSIIFSTCEKVISGEISRLVVNIPPRHSKTQIFSIFLPFFAICNNPRSHNMMVSYAEDVVGESSGYIRTLCQHPLVEKIFPDVRIDQSKRALDRWGTTAGGVMHAIPTGGRLTGKGAGSLEEGFNGLLVIDDPLKPKDAYSETSRTEVNTRYDNTILSRLANDGDENGKNRTPLIIIMQRLHSEDLVGHVLQGNSSDKFHYLNIPAVLEEDTGSKEWYEKIITKFLYTHAIPVHFKLEREVYPSALWAARKSLDTLIAMRKSDPYTYYSQYLGSPTGEGVGLVKDEWVLYYNEAPLATIRKTFMTADTASTTKSYSDYSIVCYWGISKDKKLYLLDLMVGKWETPELKKEIKSFWDKHNKYNQQYPQLLPTALYMEDKSSGHFLNQTFAREGGIRLLPVPRDTSGGDKLIRFLNAVPHFADGDIYFPAVHIHIDYVVRELTGMTPLGSGTGHDDFVDNCSDAAVVVWGAGQMSYEDWA